MEILTDQMPKLRRSVLYVPADNRRAMEKVSQLDVDCVIFDLEDAVAPDAKAEARENLRQYFAAEKYCHAERAIRINALSSPWGTEDLMCARACLPDAITLPKVSIPQDVLMLADALDQTDAPETMQIFAMIETAKAVLNIAEIAELGKTNGSRLSAFIVGMNDLVKETGLAVENARHSAHSWLMQIVLAGRAGDLDIIDAVYNDFRDIDGLNDECLDGARMGFDGKTLIHPAQIDAANAAYMPTETALLEADAIVTAFRLPDNVAKGVIQIDGKMVERLHLAQAEALLAKAAVIRGRMKDFAASEKPD